MVITSHHMLPVANAHLSLRGQSDTLTAYFEYVLETAPGPAIVVGRPRGENRLPGFNAAPYPLAGLTSSGPCAVSVGTDGVSEKGLLPNDLIRKDSPYVVDAFPFEPLAFLAAPGNLDPVDPGELVQRREARDGLWLPTVLLISIGDKPEDVEQIDWRRTEIAATPRDITSSMVATMNAFEPFSRRRIATPL
ncbi:hypothetical protein E4U17_000032 [Claviceps sp. LM77 group G4]|nr:hypothetical protein E4U17_000032 [Claviceps sp. LM77 group G4]KAG6085810.1 hypothetical protein E4U16_000023 [Claviceps sp. LM84 group G4]KAG6086522.1 hypothetical protein E4U33_004575 [Claviceps sp. LM78 group G4]